MGIAPSAKVYTTTKSTLTYDDRDSAKEYQWKSDGTDGLRSYSYAASDPNWNYSTEPDESNKDGDGWYEFSDSSTGQPFARRGNLYNWTAATLGSSLKLATRGQQAPDSICPKGWKLPTGDTASPSNDSFDRLFGVYDVTNGGTGWNRSVSKPLGYLPTGNYDYRGYISARTTYGHWWTSIIYDSESGFQLISTSDYYDDDVAYLGGGDALRC